MSKEEILLRAYENAKAAFIPVCGEECARVLREQCEKTAPERILEIGTAVGYSAAVMALACGAQVDTIDMDEERLLAARKLWEELGVSGRIHAFCGDVKAILEQVTDGKKYGLVFIDGPKSAYRYIFDHMKGRTEENAVIISDDVNYLGLVQGEGYPPHKHRTIVVNMRKYLEYISAPPFETSIFWKDGIAVTKVKKW